MKLSQWFIPTARSFALETALWSELQSFVRYNIVYVLGFWKVERGDGGAIRSHHSRWSVHVHILRTPKFSPDWAFAGRGAYRCIAHACTLYNVHVSGRNEIASSCTNNRFVIFQNILFLDCDAMLYAHRMRNSCADIIQTRIAATWNILNFRAPNAEQCKAKAVFTNNNNNPSITIMLDSWDAREKRMHIFSFYLLRCLLSSSFITMEQLWCAPP